MIYFPSRAMVRAALDSCLDSIPLLMVGRHWVRLTLAGVLLAVGLLAGWYVGTPRLEEEEYYESIRLRGARIGWSHTRREYVWEGAQTLIRTTNESQVTLARDGQLSTQRMVLTCWETTARELVRFDWRQGESASVNGQVGQGQLKLTRTTGGRSESETHPWKGWGGYFAPQDSLIDRPLQPGESRSVRSLSPFTNLATNTKLEALDWEEIDLNGTKQRLLKIRAEHALPTGEIESLMWVDRQGRLLRTLVPGMGQESIRTTRERAQRSAQTSDFDLLRDTVVKLAPPIPDFAKVKRVVYLARLQQGKIDGLFPSGASQRVHVQGEQTAQIEVVALRPDSPIADDVVSEQADAKDLAPTTFLQSDDTEVQKIAVQAGQQETDPWTIAVALEQHIRRSIRHKDYTQAFVSAADVARSLEGDCTEHAVLLAACLKARQIPARVAFGLVYVPALEGFAYHMWTEAWIADRWIPLDATQARGGIGADHIQLGVSRLQGADANADILKVMTVFGQLELSVVEAE